jgi:hypothetical protein
MAGSFRSPLLMDSDDQYLGNTPGTDGRGRLHTLSQSSGTILDGVEYDEILGAYPDAITEVYQYLLLSVLQATITVVYTSAAKDLVASVVRT